MQWKAEALFQAIAKLWADARNARINASEQNYVMYWKRTRKQMKNIQQHLASIPIAQLEAPFKQQYGWNDTQWNEFRTAAIAVYQTLVPAAIAAIEAQKSVLMNKEVGANGEETQVGTLDQAQKDVINAALQAIEDQYDLLTG